MKSWFVGIALAFVAGAGLAAAGAVGQENKIGNDSKSLKEALKSTGYDGTPDDLGNAAGDKIAALDADGLNTDAIQGEVLLAGDLVQGGLVLGTTLPGVKIRLEDKKEDGTIDYITVPVSPEGRFLLGFGRDHPTTADLQVTFPDGSARRQTLQIADREFIEQRITVDQSKVSGFTEEQLAQIRVSTEKKKKARQVQNAQVDWTGGFEWPVTGRITGVFGSRRIYNGEPRRPHSGVDVARPTGTPIRAPAAGLVTLADMNMYFEGGLVFINHGQNLESAIMHMSKIHVKAGQRVERGDIIGEVGSTGRSTGPHMHWGLKWHDRLVDPELVVPEMGG